MVGSKGPRVLRAALPHVDLWNAWHAWFGNSAAGLELLLGDLDLACERAGRDPGAVGRTATLLVGLRGGSGRVPGSPSRGSSEPVVDAAEDIAAVLAAYAAAGICHVQLVLDPITIESIATMGDVLALLDA